MGSSFHTAHLKPLFLNSPSLFMQPVTSPDTASGMTQPPTMAALSYLSPKQREVAKLRAKLQVIEQQEHVLQQRMRILKKTKHSIRTQLTAMTATKTTPPAKRLRTEAPLHEAIERLVSIRPHVPLDTTSCIQELPDPPRKHSLQSLLN
jgi:hypothetical protein